MRNWRSRTVLLVCLLPLCAALAGCGNTSTEKQATSESTRTARQAPTPPVMKPKAVSLRALVARDRSGVLRIEVDTCDEQGSAQVSYSARDLLRPSSMWSMGLVRFGWFAAERLSEQRP